MLPTTSLLQLALCLSTFGQMVAASPGQIPGHHGLIVRQDDASATGDKSNVIEPTGNSGDDEDNSDESGTSAKPEATKTTGGPRSTGRDLNTVEPESSGGTRSKTSAPKHTEFPADLPPGGADMITPSTVAGSTVLYKIGNEVEWAWNYTSLRGTPTAIDVLISCATASETWTLSSNMSFATSVNFTWDTTKERDDTEKPLLTELYTLIIKDSDAEISDAPEAGYLGAYSGFTFGLYAPQPYTPMADWKCIACDSAAPSLNSQAVGLAFFMSMISVLSFTWFVTGFGLQ
jgi:hypothetical protein